MVFFILCFCVYIIITSVNVVLILYHSVNGYNDLKGITNCENDFKPWKVMFIVCICSSIIITLFMLVMIINFFKLWKENNYIKKIVTFTVVICLLSGYVSAFNMGFESIGRNHHSFNVKWDTQTIQFVENHYDCCIKENGEKKCKECKNEFYKIFDMR